MLTALFAALAPFQPTLVGTLPLGLQVAGSDVDVICSAQDRLVFEEVLAKWLVSTRIDSAVWRREEKVVSVRFEISGTPVEVYCARTPVHEQFGFRHMAVEARLLALGGAALRERVRALKVNGIKTEPAFARVLGLAGDPYLALLELETWSNDQVRTHLGFVLNDEV